MTPLHSDGQRLNANVEETVQQAAAQLLLILTATTVKERSQRSNPNSETLKTKRMQGDHRFIEIVKLEFGECKLNITFRISNFGGTNWGLDPKCYVVH